MRKIPFIQTSVFTDDRFKFTGNQLATFWCEEKNELTQEEIEHNIECIKKQLYLFLDFSADNAPLVLNNYDWVSPFSFLGWLRDVGKHFNLNYMLAKKSVKERIGSQKSISFTEFAYMTIQAFDFLHLFKKDTCTLQCGGSD